MNYLRVVAKQPRPVVPKDHPNRDGRANVETSAQAEPTGKPNRITRQVHRRLVREIAKIRSALDRLQNLADTHLSMRTRTRRTGPKCHAVCFNLWKDWRPKLGGKATYAKVHEALLEVKARSPDRNFKYVPEKLATFSHYVRLGRAAAPSESQ